MHRRKRILVSWYADPRYIPPFTLSTRQVTVGPKSFPDQPAMMFAGFTPGGEHDLKAAVDTARIEGPFDAVVVWADASGINLPLNLEAFDCPKVLCVGDTHHLTAPLRTMIAYAKRARYDYILSSHNRQHLHWFKEAGFGNAAWVPGLKVRHTPRPLSAARKRMVVFAGNASQYHARRTRMMDALTKSGVTFTATRAPREVTADLFASSIASFNASLNGDLNLRVFEILSSGGCLLTDRLAPESGLSLLLQEGRDYVAYDSVDECVAQAEALLRAPKAAFDIAAAGNRAFVASMLPEQRAEQFLTWVFDGRLDSVFQPPTPPASPAPALDARLLVYEALQELHRLQERPEVLFAGDIPPVLISDSLDLSRANLSIGRFDDGVLPPLEASLARRVVQIGRMQMERTHWDAVVLPAADRLPPSVRAKQTIAF